MDRVSVDREAFNELTAAAREAERFLRKWRSVQVKLAAAAGITGAPSVDEADRVTRLLTRAHDRVGEARPLRG